ncbi:pathogenesis-related homeodomain [Olea europaea subsp. europaea]|uniref:Pathogenesis-related homeodomain n=1 Tax=Olea europaea subsp. europaea TaxID=158383 RepID=A0A8S0TQL5_OLEEU|nr:pathogenesis-related homeodomain [Olea europaea subsp. europaea]
MSGSVNMDVPVQQENCETKGAASPKLLAGEGREVLHYTNLLSQNCHEVDNVQKGLSEVGIQESKQPTVEGREELHFTTVGYDLLEQKCQKVENAQKGSRGEETQVSQYNELERLEISEVLYQNSCIEPQTPKDCVVTELIEQKEVVGAENIKNKIALTEETTTGFEEVGPTSGDITQNFSAEQKGPLLENMTLSSVIENLEVSSENKAITVVLALGYFETPCGRTSVNTLPGQAGAMEKNLNKDTSLLKAEEEGTPVQFRTSKNSVNNKWVLRSKSQEKPKASDPKDTTVQDNANGEKKRRGRKRKEMNKGPVNEFSRTRTHLRYLMHRIRYEQNLIDAYSAEGWKRQSLEKLKPEKELQRAKSHILDYKLRIRELFQGLDLSLAVGKLPASLFDSAGEIDSEDIFCSKCGSKDITTGNDIILCDGACERGFHQFCLEPPLLKQDIPPDDESWLCPGCDCKVDCIGYLNDFQGTNLSVIDSWEKIFPEATASVSGKKLDDGSGSLSDDSEDDDYDPDKPDTVLKVSGDGLSNDKSGDQSSSDDSDYLLASDDLTASPNTKQYLGLPSDDSEDDDFDPAAPVQDEEVEQDSSSSDFTSDSEDLGALLDDAAAPEISPVLGANEEKSKAGKVKSQSLRGELSYLLETSDAPLSGKRRVERLDYKKLNDETYGNSSSESSDEDFEDIPSQKRRKINREKADVVSPDKTPLAGNEMDYSKDKNLKESEHGSERTSENVLDNDTINAPAEMGSVRANVKRSAPKRLGEAVTQRLLESFRQNQYPERAVKENLAKELELTIQQVTKWFENTRWSFNHRPQMELKKNETDSKQGTSLNHDNKKRPDLESESVANDNSSSGVAKLVTEAASGYKSGMPKSRKRESKTDQSPDTQIQEQNMLVDAPSSEVRRSSRLKTRNSGSVE